MDSRIDWLRYFITQDPQFDWTTVTPAAYQAFWDRSYEQYGIVIGTDNPDLSAFRDRGGKTIIWHGLADQLITAEGTIDYYTRVQQRMGGAKQTSAFARLFLAPGVAHCSGGPGPQPTGVLDALVSWVEEGKAPETLTADSARSSPAPSRARGRCASTRSSRGTAGRAVRTTRGTSSAASHYKAASERRPQRSISSRLSAGFRWWRSASPATGPAARREFLKSLVHHPRFAGTVNDIVVEFGNARYQDVADRYVFGEPVAREELKQIWENTTIVSGVWTAPMYEGMLARGPGAERVASARASECASLLGDPPIDWSVVRGPADEDMNDWRDAHFAWVVEEQVMKKHRRALIWIGGAHLSRHVRFPNSLIHLLDRRFPNQTLVALSIDRQEVDQETSDRLGEWRSLAAAPVAGHVVRPPGRQRRLGWQSLDRND